MKADKLTTKEYLIPFILISSFLPLGIAHGMLDNEQTFSGYARAI